MERERGEERAGGPNWFNDYVIPICVLAALFGVFVLYRSLQSFRAELSHYALETEEKLEHLESALSALRRQEERIHRRELSELEPFEEIPSVDQDLVKNGLYVLERPIEIRYPNGKGNYTERFTIYHIKTAIPGGSHPWVIQVGLALSGLTTTPQFYMDTEGDGIVDVAVMQEFVKFIPFGKVILKSLTEANAQATYNAFLGHHAEASFTPLEQIGGSESTIVRELWNFVQSKAEAIGKWLDKRESKATALGEATAF